ncbi:MAG: hypothetical protein K6G16_10920 [Lachnospiraceae bacterium]|nr:hypothetical protein [Lachnospiraceae bacterium]
MGEVQDTYYFKCNMTKTQHILAYVICSLIAGVIVFLFYHAVIAAIPLGLFAGIFLEKIYANHTIRKRQQSLRSQFKDFLDSMAVAVRAGNVEVQAVRYALGDLQLTYNSETDIIREVSNIIKQYEMGGRKLTALFADLGERSDLEDIRNFATVYEVIEGKSDRFGEILSETRDIIAKKIEVEQEIETTITAAKTETNTMLLMPVIVVIAMSAMGGGFMDAMFTTAMGRVAATAALAIFAVSYVLADKAARIDA